MQTQFVPAIVTPFHSDSLHVDEESFKTYLKVALISMTLLAMRHALHK